MVILRPTRRLRTWLPVSKHSSFASDTALGDWYASRIVVDHQPLLILLSSTSLLALLLPARNVRELPQRLGALVEARLRRCGIAAPVIDAEKRAMAPIAIGPTVDRSVLGIMVDFARAVPFHLESGRWDEATLLAVEDQLAENPCYAGRSIDEVVFPEKKAPELLRAKWGAG